MDLSDLNEEQTRAVLAPIKNILVSAGAGSGKTARTGRKRTD